MKTTVLLTTAVLALALAGCNKSTRSPNTASDETANANTDYTATHADTTNTSSTNALNTNTNDFRTATNSAASAIGSAATNVATSARIAEWKLTPSDIQADLDNNNAIVRTKQEAGAPTGSTDRKVIESMVKARLQADSEIAPLKLDVDANRHGEVKLSGKANSAEEVGRAIALALDTEGVTKVTSKVKLDKSAKTNR